MSRTTPKKGKSTRAQSITTIERNPALPFVVTHRGLRGACVGFDYFHVEPGRHYFEGYQQGLDAAAAMLAEVKAGGEGARYLAAVLKTAAKRADDKNPAVDGAAHGFMAVVCEAVRFTAKRGAWEGYFEDKTRENARWVEIENRHHAERTARAIAARKAKKAAKVEGGAQ